MVFPNHSQPTLEKAQLGLEPVLPLLKLTTNGGLNHQSWPHLPYGCIPVGFILCGNWNHISNEGSLMGSLNIVDRLLS